MCRILCVDDDHDSLEVAKAILELSDPHYHIDCAQSVDEARELIAAGGRYQLYFIDHWMPSCSGLELCRWIRTFDTATPIIVHSGAVGASDRYAAYNSGADHFLAKPTGIDELDTVARHYLHPSSRPCTRTPQSA
ncbi:MAG: PleD family two-component system response regulator [Pyrinomonadaceae bacterium]